MNRDPVITRVVQVGSGPVLSRAIIGQVDI